MKYTSLSTKNTNQRHCLLNNVAASLRSVKQRIVALSTADGSHNHTLYMKSHESFLCSADSLHC